MKKHDFLSQFHVSPPMIASQDFPLRETGRAAAVLVPLLNYTDGLRVLFTQRASHLTHHPGQVSFPGGKVERHDRNLTETALREAWEEVGLPREQCQIVGSLPPHHTLTGFHITAVVAIVEPAFSLNIDPNEVHDTFEVPLSFLLNPDNHLIESVQRGNLAHPVHFILWQERMIWGATAALISQLASIFHDTRQPAS
ncbi:CoA pyrophosphatase [Alteromonas gilva]|uniref:CoA pyrophosphatase n=1 Tax=Alteromonas gilva TaxID=2987522 RepID=A0ABT5L1U9_9ALTE|nr:CoA pyrophosphatase [Alteromonas gilva]MDC8831018.1 CoA pyrophosphatase [Alteromonas gilva]